MDLTETLKLERIEVNLFRGTSPDPTAGRIFGGQVIAQALLAAYKTLEDRVCHSLHCYFMRLGDPTVPIIFDVDRSRDGGSYATRRVVAIQHGQQIFNLAASFQKSETGLEHQIPMPKVPSWEGLEDDWDVLKEVLRSNPDPEKPWVDRPRPVEMRSLSPRFEIDPEPSEPIQQIWFRAVEPAGDDPRMHQVILAFASDMALLGTASRPHGVSWQSSGYMSASLDHAMWFHQPTNVNGWHFYDMDSPSASGGRGLNRGTIYSADGTLIASCAQEGMIRMRRPDR